MAATFVVEDGTGLSTANALISEAEADQYHDNNGTRTAWDLASDKEQAIRSATKYLEVKYKGRWLGSRAVATQALSWPRAGVEDCDGYAVDSDSIPQDIKNACAELALDTVTESDLLADETSPVGIIKRQRNKVGEIEQDIEYIGGADSTTLRTTVAGLVRNYVTDSDVLERG